MAEPDTRNPVLLHPKSLRELGALLVRDAGLHEGLFDISFEIQTMVGSFGPAEEILPGALFGIRNVGLVQTGRRNPNTVDAAQVNPRAKPATKRAKVGSGA